MSKSQINLPKTAFSMKANLPIREPEILEYWKKINLYDELRNSNKGKEKFILHDGPPYANGNIHMGTALNKILKDIIVKFHQMDGKDSIYVPGWDCHGLPIEWKIEEQYKKRKKNKDETVKLILLDKKLNIINDKLKNGIKIRLQKIKDFPTYALRQVIDQGKKEINKGIIVAVCNFEGKIGVAVGVTSNLTYKFDAVKLVKIASEVLGGKGGGGRKDFAQAGGEDQNKIDDVFNKILKEIN